MTQGILKTDDDFMGVVFKGIGPEYDPTFLKEQNLVEGRSRRSATQEHQQDSACRGSWPTSCR